MKQMFFSLLVAAGGLFAHTSHREIECEIRQIDHAKIHPTKQYDTIYQATSSNWSGYVASSNLTNATLSKNSTTHVGGEWVVPTLLPTPDTSYCAIWVGLDGFNSSTVEQIGTSHNWVNGAQQDYAWFEMYPNAAYEIGGFPVNQGDVISATVGNKGNGVFRLVMTNHTQGVVTTIPYSYTTSTSALSSCAEWIVEAPYSGQTLPLSDFKLVTFNYCSAIIDGISGAVDDNNWDCVALTMDSASGALEASTSALMKNGNCFQVSWKSE